MHCGTEFAKQVFLNSLSLHQPSFHWLPARNEVKQCL